MARKQCELKGGQFDTKSSTIEEKEKKDSLPVVDGDSQGGTTDIKEKSEYLLALRTCRENRQRGLFQRDS